MASSRKHAVAAPRSAPRSAISTSGSGRAPTTSATSRWIPNGRPTSTRPSPSMRRGNTRSTNLVEELYERGLRARATSKNPEGKLGRSALARILKDPYHVGIVRFRGVDYDGSHPTFIEPETFQKVQEILEGHHRAGESTGDTPTISRDRSSVGSAAADCSSFKQSVAAVCRIGTSCAALATSVRSAKRPIFAQEPLKKPSPGTTRRWSGSTPSESARSKRNWQRPSTRSATT